MSIYLSVFVCVCIYVAGHYPAVQSLSPARFSGAGYTARTLLSSPGWKGAGPEAYLPGIAQWQELQTFPGLVATPSLLTLAL